MTNICVWYVLASALQLIQYFTTFLSEKERAELSVTLYVIYADLYTFSCASLLLVHNVKFIQKFYVL